MKNLPIYLLFAWFQTLDVFSGPAFPFAPAAGETNSTAIPMNASNIVAWADGYTNMLYGADVSAEWKTPAKALGPAAGTSGDIVSLGRSGEITLTFSKGITDGPGMDFAVFENGFDNFFLELGWVEVSSDGQHFVRFPNYSYTDDPVGAFGQIDATFIYGYAGKYRQGFGTPFDISELQRTADEIAAGNSEFSAEYIAAFNTNFPHLNPSWITHVKLVDINGNGSLFDAEGFVIFDPYKTAGSAGLDVDAVGVMNQPFDDRIPQTIAFSSIPNQRLDFQTLELSAVAGSGLPVELKLQSGPAELVDAVLTFIGTGIVEVVASQEGDAVYAPASSVLRSFHVAEAVQHIFIEPIPDQLASNTTFKINAMASSGLPVHLEVYRGPDGTVIHPTNHVMTLTNEVGLVTLHASQSGNAATAPAEDVYVSFQITTNPPVPFADWLSSNSVPDPVFQTQEDAYGRPAVTLEYPIDAGVKATSRILQSLDLVSWTHAVPEIVEMNSSNIVLQLTAEETNEFYRLEFEGQ